MPAPTLRSATFADLDPATLYALLRMRVDVFVVEQRCPYPELDGRDTEPGTVHLWLERDGKPLAYLRMLAEPDGSVRIGRVAVAAPHRRNGYAGRLLTAAHARAGTCPVVLDAQTYLAGFYARYGYRVTGEEFREDGIWHVPMRRDRPTGDPHRDRPPAAGPDRERPLR